VLCAVNPGCDLDYFKAVTVNLAYPLLIFADFDGTVAARDVGYNLFRHFSGGKNEELLPDWKSGKISSRECLIREAAMVRASVDEIYTFLEDFSIDKSFAPFLAEAKTHGAKVTILSDGLDIYINRLFAAERIQGIEVFSNRGIIENGGLRVEFPHESEGCARCGNCKGARIAEARAEAGADCRTVFVGDGYSDLCAIKESDFLFAKKDLERHCIESNIEYLSYDTFSDVGRALYKIGLFKNL